VRGIPLVVAGMCVLPLLLFFPVVQAQTLVTVIPLGTQNLNEGAFGPPVFDPSNGNIYVSALGTTNMGTVSIISGSANTVTSILGLSTPQHRALPGIGLLDPSNGDIYVPDGPVIHVISGTTNDVIQNISGMDFSGSGSLAFDPSNGMIYAPNSLQSSLSVVDTSNNSVVATLHLPSGAEELPGPIFDPANGDVYLPGFNATTVISATTDSIVATIPFANGASYLVVDPSTGSVLASGSGRLVVISSSNQVVANVSSEGAGYSVFDPSNSDFYSLTSSSSVEVFSAKTNSIVGNMSLNFDQETGTGTGLAIDSSNGNVFATFDVSGVIVNSHSVTATFGDVISGTTVLGQLQLSNSSSTFGNGGGSAVFDSANGDFYVPNSDGTVSVVNPQVAAESSSTATSTSSASHAGSLSPAYVILIVADLLVVLSALIFVRVRRARL
jgi:YVTN family beta-propeller protein